MSSRPIRWVLEGLKLIFAISALCSFVAQGQEAKAPDQLPAAPPMRAISREERNQLQEAKDPRARIKRTVELAELRLQQAETQASQQKYDRALIDLGGYLALIDDGLQFLERLSNNRDKPRDLFKRMELALRAHGPRFTLMRRTTPLEYAVRIKEVEDFAREGRTEALDAFYGNTVVRDGRQKKPDEDNKQKETSHKPERQP